MTGRRMLHQSRTADVGQVSKLENIRRAWEAFFFQATERRMQAITTLR